MKLNLRNWNFLKLKVTSIPKREIISLKFHVVRPQARTFHDLISHSTQNFFLTSLIASNQLSIDDPECGVKGEEASGIDNVCKTNTKRNKKKLQLDDYKNLFRITFESKVLTEFHQHTPA